MRQGLVGIFALGCTSSAPSEVARPPVPAPAATRTEPPAGREAGPRFLLGVVGQGGREHCPDGAQRQWIDVHPTIGFVSISGVPDRELERLMDEAVLAEGAVTGAPPRPESGIERQPCPPAQARSDFVSTPRGVRMRRGDGLDIAHFSVRALRRLDELWAEVEGDEVVVHFENRLPEALEALRLTIHFEGCFGKPGTYAHPVEIGTLAPGQAATARAPTHHVQHGASPRGGGRTFRAYSVSVSATSSVARFDLDASLRRMGAAIECPDSDARKPTRGP